MLKIKEYDKTPAGFVGRKADYKLMRARGWEVIQEEEVTSFNGKKGCLFFIIFPPLALLARSKKVKVTYEK
jgi:hypothetical protein